MPQPWKDLDHPCEVLPKSKGMSERGKKIEAENEKLLVYTYHPHSQIRD